MKHFSIIAVVALFGACAAQKYSATQNNNEIVIVRSENENDGAGNFRWASELSDGTKLDQSGYVKEGPDPENPIQVIQGSYSYISPEGQQIDLTYTADENGFAPQGNHLPTPPPVPEAIQKAIDLILRNAEAGGAPAAPAPQQPRRPAPQPPRRG